MKVMFRFLQQYVQCKILFLNPISAHQKIAEILTSPLSAGPQFHTIPDISESIIIIVIPLTLVFVQ